MCSWHGYLMVLAWLSGAGHVVAICCGLWAGLVHYWAGLVHYELDKCVDGLDWGATRLVAWSSGLTIGLHGDGHGLGPMEGCQLVTRFGPGWACQLGLASA